MSLVPHFFPEGEGKSKVLPFIEPGATEFITDLMESGLPRLVIATCAADDTWARVERFEQMAMLVNTPDYLVAAPVAVAEFEVEFEPDEEFVIPVVTIDFGPGDLLFRLDKTKRIKRRRLM